LGDEKNFIRCLSKEQKPSHPLHAIVQELCRTSLQEGTVDGFLTLVEKKKGNGMQAVSVEMATDVSSLDGSLFSQFLVGGLPRLLSIPKVIHTQLGGSFDKRLAVVARPCDVRALVELTKRHQVAFNNLFIIGLECLGNVPILDLLNVIKKRGIDPSKIESCQMTPTDVLVKISDGDKVSLKIGKDIRLRECCSRCNNRDPIICDITLSTLGKDGSTDGAVFIRLETERGKKCFELAEKQGLLAAVSNPTLEGGRQESIVKSLEKQATEKLTAENAAFLKLDGKQRFDQFKKMIEPCTKCGLCVRACPVCWCKDCVLLKKIKTIDPILLHVTRLEHMADTCVNCGKCDENCPKAIQLSRIYYGLASELSRITGYRPGLSLDQAPQRSGKVILHS